MIARGRFDEALVHCQQALEIHPNLAMAENNLGRILAYRGQFDEALAHYQRALQIEPNFAAAHTCTGDVLAGWGRFLRGADHYRRALQIQPQDPMAQCSLAWLRATCSDPSLQNSAEAMERAQRANQLTGGKQPGVLSTLAAAYAAGGLVSRSRGHRGKHWR